MSLEAAVAHSLIAVEHTHRYRVGAELCSGLRVVDLCCGSGYGSRILRETAASVVGVDNDVRTVDMANASVGQEADVSFEVADAHEFLRRDLWSDFDAVVLLEGLEHLENPADALQSLVRLAEHGMRLVMSVPNSKTLGESNPYHVTDFDYESARAAFADFDDCVWLYQFLAEGSLITAGVEAEPVSELVDRERGEPAYANHYLVCVNAGDAASRASALATLELAPVHNRYMLNLESANEELRRANARLAREQLGKADSAAASLVARLEAERAALEAAKRHLAGELDPEAAARAERQALVQRIEELHDQVLAQDRQLRDLTATRGFRLVTSYWRLRDHAKRAVRLGRPRNS